MYKRAIEKIDTEGFNSINEKMNEITKKYNELVELEEKAQKGNIFSRARNGLRAMVGLEEKVKVPKKVLELRENLANTISEFTTSIKQDKYMEETFNSYVAVRRNILDGYKINLESLQNIPYKLRAYGCLRVNNIPRRTVKNSELKVHAKRKENEAIENSNKLQKQKEGLETETNELYAKLNSKAKKMISTDENKMAILNYAQRYYGVNSDGKIVQKNEKNISASAAVLILEGVLGKRKIPMENIFKYYADIIGMDKLSDETIDINKTIYSKVNSLKEQISGMAKNSKEEEHDNER